MGIQKFKTQSHEEWLALRKQYIGGSDAGAIVGMNPYRSAFALWMEKTGKAPGFEGNLATEVGSFLEEFVAQKWAEVTGNQVRRCNLSMVNDQYPWAIANIDRDVVGVDEGLECKTTSELNLRKFKDVEFPEIYYCQCVHYMAVTGKKAWNLAVLVGNREFLIFRLERDEDEIAALMAAEREFWERVQNGTPPEVDGSESTARAIGDLYPDGNGECVDLTAYTNDFENYFRLQARKKELEASMDEIANRVKLFMGSSGMGLCEGVKVSWKSSTRSTFDSKAFLEDHPEYRDAYTRTTETRTFRVTKKGA